MRCSGQGKPLRGRTAGVLAFNIGMCAGAGVEQSKAGQSRAEQSNAEQSNAEQSRAEHIKAKQSRAAPNRAVF